MFLRHRAGINNLQSSIRTNSIPFSCARAPSLKINNVSKNFSPKRTISTWDFRTLTLEERLQYGQERNVPLGVNDFNQIMFNKHYYADKSMFIKEFFDGNDKVSLFLRPHRFGRSTLMTFLRDFCNKETANDCQHFFKGLDIYFENGGHYWNSFAGAFPVVHLSFDACTGSNWEEMKTQINNSLSSGLSRHKYLATSFFILTSDEKKELRNVLAPNSTVDSLQIVPVCLQKYWKAPCLVIIDDYDVPLLKGLQYGFGEQVSQYLQPIVTSLLKDNESVYRGVLVGATPIQGSFLKDIPNVAVYSLLSSKKYLDKFGFTKKDADDFMATYNLGFKTGSALQYAGNYKTLSDDVALANITSILSVGTLKNVGPLWLPAVVSDFISNLLKASKPQTKQLLMKLLSGQSVETKLNPVDVKADPNDDQNTLPLLYYHGYLTATVKTPTNALQSFQATLQIPNTETLQEFGFMARGWLQTGSLHLQNTISALCQKDIETGACSFGDAVSDIYKSKELPNDLHNFHETFGLCVWAWGNTSHRVATIEARDDHIVVCSLPALGRGTAVLYKQLSPSSIHLDATITQLRTSNPEAYEQAVRSQLKAALESASQTFKIEETNLNSDMCETAVICHTMVYEHIAEIVAYKHEYGPRQPAPKPNLITRPIKTIYGEIV